MCQDKYNTKKEKYKHINYVERMQIERWHNKDKKSKAEIAELINKDERTIRREINRGLTTIKDSLWRDIEVYSADISQKKYNYNIKGKGPELKIGNDYELKKYIETEIKKYRKSPEALVAEIRKKGLKFKVDICAKTIRNTINLGNVLEVTGKDMIYKKKYKNRNKEKKICDKIPAEKSIEFRPKEANTREEYGHWEGDLVIGTKKRGSVLFTLTERKTREEIIIKLANKKSGEITKAMDKLEQIYNKRFYNKFKTITFDNGGEFRRYGEIEKSCIIEGNRIKVYYAHPYCSGERGSNENNNRLIRRFIPKGMSINKLSEEFIQWIEDWINSYPRAMFGYKSSLEIV